MLVVKLIYVKKGDISMNKKIIEMAKKHIVLTGLFLLVAIPILINRVFLIPAPFDFLAVDWEAKETLSYYGTVLTGLASAYLAYFAIQQSKKANDLSERLLKIEETNKKAYVKLNISETVCQIEKDRLFLYLIFENISEVPIVYIEFNETNDNLINDTNVPQNIVSQFEMFPIDTVSSIQDKFKCNMIIKYYENGFYFFSFIVSIKGLYNYDTKQLFTLILHDNKILDFITKQID